MHFANLLAFAGASLIALTGVQAASNFRETCNLWNLNGNTLQASCRKLDGSYNTSYLDLNKCVVNNGGTLYCLPDGNYSSGCSGCSMNPGSSTLVCKLCVPGGTNANVDLNQCVGNNNGQLNC